MKDGVIISYNGEEFCLSAHELIEYSIGIVRRIWEDVQPQPWKIYEGCFSSPIEFTDNNINKLISFVKTIQPGLSKGEKATVKDFIAAYPDRTRKIALEYYFDLFLKIAKPKETATPTKEFSWKGWRYKEEEITTMININQELVSDNLISKSSCQQMQRLNQYIVDDKIDDDFLQLYMENYDDKISEKILLPDLETLIKFLESSIESINLAEIRDVLKSKRPGYLDEAVQLLLNLIKEHLALSDQTCLLQKDPRDQVSIIAELTRGREICKLASGTIKIAALKKLIGLGLNGIKCVRFVDSYRSTAKEISNPR